MYLDSFSSPIDSEIVSLKSPVRHPDSRSSKAARGAAFQQPVSGCPLSHSPTIVLQKNEPDCTLLTILPTGRGTAKGIYEPDSVNTAKFLTRPPQASPLSSPTQRTRRLPRTHSRPQLSSRASLESIIEESSNDNSEHPATHATSNPTPNLVGGKELHRSTVSRPPGWNGKKGITTGRGMRDVCGIWYVGYSALVLFP
jgi:hypothetical protein